MISPGYRYTRWDGSQSIFSVDAEELMERLTDDLFAEGDVLKAMRELFRRGMQGQNGERMPGLQDMLQRLRDQRQQQLQRHNMDSVMDDLKKRLDEVVDTERMGIQRRLKDAAQEIKDAEGPERRQMEEMSGLLEERARTHHEKLDALPESVGGAIQELSTYDFMDPEAQRLFQELLDMLKQQMADNMVQGMKEELKGMTPERIEAMREMLRELNHMLREKMMGLEPDFQSFMEKFGQMFGPNPPQSLEELMQRIQQQMAQMQSLMNSMSLEARRDLEEAMGAAMDPGTMEQMAELAALMNRMMPINDLAKQYPFMGEDSLTLEQAMELMGELQQMDQMEGNLRQAMRTGDLDEIDPEKLAELLGEEARQNWEQLQELQRMLEEAGYITGGDQPELTPRGIRKIGQRALKEVFSQLKKDRVGSHQMFLRGASGDRLEETKAYEYGDPFEVHLQQSLKNAVLRNGPSIPVRMAPDDFEIYRSEHSTQAATVVLLDQSRSMGMFDAFQAAKKVAMALFSLISTQYPRDALYVIGFSDYAYEIREDELLKTTWNTWSPGTNLHHALMLSRRLLSKEKTGTRQIIVITDGEPTAHLEGEYAYFNYPPTSRTVLETLKEVRRCTQAGIIINTFMLENSYQLMNFVDQITRINKGRAFYSSPQALGEYVLVDYVKNRRRRVE